MLIFYPRSAQKGEQSVRAGIISENFVEERHLTLSFKAWDEDWGLRGTGDSYEGDNELRASSRHSRERHRQTRLGFRVHPEK